MITYHNIFLFMPILLSGKRVVHPTICFCFIFHQTKTSKKLEEYHHKENITMNYVPLFLWKVFQIAWSRLSALLVTEWICENALHYIFVSKFVFSYYQHQLNSNLFTVKRTILFLLWQQTWKDSKNINDDD